MTEFMDYENKKSQLVNQLKNSAGSRAFLKKKTASNLFRYMKNSAEKEGNVAVSDFDQIIKIDPKNKTLDVEGLASYENIVKATLKYGLLPTVAPELKHITIGGAIVGIGIESTSYKYGFVHDGLLEAEVLLPNGKVVLCTAQNDHADLFYSLPNSYGTLGYILRAKIKLYPAEPFVKIISERYDNLVDFMDAMLAATRDQNISFLEGLVFSVQEFYLLKTQFVSHANDVDDIYKKNIFYKLIQKKNTIYLTTEDYIFRYDPDWFWNIPETFVYSIFRAIAPKKFRNSGFYKKYIDTKNRLLSKLGINVSLTALEETLIQDWQVPWKKGPELMQFALENIDLGGKPWAIVPIQPLHSATSYPLRLNELYFNLGCYCASKRNHTDRFYNTKIMDEKCFALTGLKMLYSSTDLTRDRFEELYNGKEYREIKKKYDPEAIVDDLYNKVIAHQSS